MEKIVNLQDYRTRTGEKRGFGPWRNRFGEAFGGVSRLSDLSNRTLYLLALPGEESTEAFYELIMGVLKLGPVAKFSYLEKADQVMVMDIHLFLADQVRFEMMCRLGWLERLPCGKYRIVEMVQSLEQSKSFCEENPPKLASSHPDYEIYRKLHHMDKEASIRRMLPDALEVFRENIKE